MAEVVESQSMLVGFIVDRETANGFLIAGAGQCTKIPSNFLIVENDTTTEEIDLGFKALYGRKDICVILIGCDAAHRIKNTINLYKNKTIPIVMEIPSKLYIEKTPLDEIARLYEPVTGEEH